MLKIKDKDGTVVGILKDEDSKPAMKCRTCEGTGWDFKKSSPPFKKCICKNRKENTDANL